MVLPLDRKSTGWRLEIGSLEEAEWLEIKRTKSRRRGFTPVERILATIAVTALLIALWIPRRAESAMPGIILQWEERRCVMSRHAEVTTWLSLGAGTRSLGLSETSWSTDRA